MNKHISENPWKGLNFYIEGELLYGRNVDIKKLGRIIFNSGITVIYGKSGIGKTSLLNAGIFPEARKKGVVPLMVRLKHDGDLSYIDQIRQSLKYNNIELSEKVAPIGPHETLWEFFHRHHFTDKSGEVITPMIVIDQFEEIFTLQKNPTIRRQFFNELADLVNDVMPIEIIERQTKKDKDNRAIEKSIDSGVFRGLNLKFKLNATEANENYISSPSYHLVFSLREDFLSELEIHAYNIPQLHNNRYALLPLNEEQAAEIIIKPHPGLIDLNTAKKIVEKVTGKTEFAFDGIPEIEVNALMLSLYLSRLFEKMLEEGDSTITLPLIERYGKTLIDDFYVSELKGLPRKGIEWLEDNLINSDGRRDNREKMMVIRESGLTMDQLDYLINDVKILRQFSFGGDLRIEYIHDIIGNAVVQHRNQRKSLLHQKQMRQRNYILLGFIAALLILIIFLVFWSSSKLSTYKYSFVEDDTINLSEYWKGDLSILDNSGNCIVKTTIDKSSPVIVFESGQDIKNPSLNIDFLVGNLRIDTIVRGDKKNEFEVVLTQAIKRRPIKGKIISNVGSRAPVAQGLVIIDDQVAITDYKGEFTLYVDEAYSDNTIRIIKNGYRFYEGKLSPNSLYVIRMADDFKFYDEAKQMEKRLANSVTVDTLKGRFYNLSNGGNVYGNAVMVLAENNDSIYGYTYYDKIYKARKNKFDSYFLLEGIKKEGTISYEMTLKDAVNNSAKYSVIHEGNCWKGDVYDKNVKVGYFEFYP